MITFLFVLFSQEQHPKVWQVDLVPTMSLLLGAPIPFSNLGAVITDLFSLPTPREMAGAQSHNLTVEHNLLLAVKALQLNALQVSLARLANLVKSQKTSGSHFAEQIFKDIYLKENFCYFILLKFVWSVLSAINQHCLRQWLADNQTSYWTNEDSILWPLFAWSLWNWLELEWGFSQKLFTTLKREYNYLVYCLYLYSRAKV